jgi:transcriptional regulator with XRE-family HTH domain
MRSDREKADDRSITGVYKDLAVEVRRMLGYYSDDLPLLSARHAALKSGVNHATISGLIRGARASRETLRQLAGAFDVDETRLLVLAGYSPLMHADEFPAKQPVELTRTYIADGLPQRIYHKINRLSDRDLMKLDQILELWVDNGQEIGS